MESQTTCLSPISLTSATGPSEKEGIETEPNDDESVRTTSWKPSKREKLDTPAVEPIPEKESSPVTGMDKLREEQPKLKLELLGQHLAIANAANEMLGASLPILWQLNTCLPEILLTLGSIHTNQQYQIQLLQEQNQLLREQAWICLQLRDAKTQSASGLLDKAQGPPNWPEHGPTGSRPY